MRGDDEDAVGRDVEGEIDRALRRGAARGERTRPGAVRDFRDALLLVWARCAAEEALLCQGGASPEDLRTQKDSHDQIASALLHAGRLYREELERARIRTVRRLREDIPAARAALDDQAATWLGLLAACLEEGDYGRLSL